MATVKTLSESQRRRAISSAEGISLLSLVNPTPYAPRENPRPSQFSRDDPSRMLPFDCEVSLTSTLAFLCGISDDSNHVVATCVEELVDVKGLRVLVAVNKTNPKSNHDILQRIEVGLTKILRCLSRAGNEQNILVLEHQVLTAVLELCEYRLLSRIRSKRLDVVYQKRKDRPFLGSTVEGIIQAVRAHQGNKRNLPLVQRFLDRATKFGKLLGELETCPRKRLRAYLGAISLSAFRLVTDIDFDKVFSGLTPAELDPTTKTSFVRCLRKLARYREIPQFLIQLAKKSRLFEQATVFAVALDEGCFLRHHGIAIDYDLKNCLARYQGGSSPLNIEGISRRLKKGTNHASSEFSQTVKDALEESKIHAEVQIVAYYELNPVSRPPRVICSSKDACYLCNEFVQLHGKFYIPRTHGNPYTGWLVPSVPSLSQAHDRLNKFLRSETKKTLQRFRNQPDLPVVRMRNENESTILNSTLLMASLDRIVIPTRKPSEETSKAAKNKQPLKKDTTVKIPTGYTRTEPQQVLKCDPLSPSRSDLDRPLPKQADASIAASATTNPSIDNPAPPDHPIGQPTGCFGQVKRSRTRGQHYVRASS